MLIHGLGVTTGVFLIIIGFLNPTTPSLMFGLIAGMAVFLEAGNGANFSLVPHVHPYANGKSIYSSPLKVVNLFGRYCLRVYWRHWELWRHHLLHHFQIQCTQVREIDVDRRNNDPCYQSSCQLDQTDTKGPNWWKIMRCIEHRDDYIEFAV